MLTGSSTTTERKVVSTYLNATDIIAAIRAYVAKQFQFEDHETARFRIGFMNGGRSLVELSAEAELSRETIIGQTKQAQVEPAYCARPVLAENWKVHPAGRIWLLPRLDPNGQPLPHYPGDYAVFYINGMGAPTCQVAKAASCVDLHYMSGVADTLESCGLTIIGYPDYVKLGGAIPVPRIDNVTG